MQKQIRPIVSSPFAKFGAYFKACVALGHVNLRGLPLLPKQLCPDTPFNREQYNTFIDWLSILQLADLRIVIDVGANCGDFTQAVSAFSHGAVVYMVEPLPSLYDGLQRLCAKSNGRFHLSKKALSDKPGKADGIRGRNARHPSQSPADLY